MDPNASPADSDPSHPAARSIEAFYGANDRGQAARRALVDVMVAAAAADGAIAAEELSRLRDALASCAVFAPLGPDALETLLGESLARGATNASDTARLAALAAPLRSRAERVLAYALACDLCAFDARLPPTEVAFLEALRRALFIPQDEARDVFESVRTFAGAFAIEEQLDRVRATVPATVDAMALMALADGRTDAREAAAMVALLRGSADTYAYDDAALRQTVDEALARVAARPAAEVIEQIARTAVTPQDRFWTVAYVQVVMTADDEVADAERAMLDTLRRALGLAREDVAGALALAEQLAPHRAS